MITAVYNQVIAYVDTTNGVPVLDLSGTDFGAYFEDFEYVDDGAGTNTLVFKTTAKKDITPEEILSINAFFVENSSWWNNDSRFVAKVANLNGDVTE